MTTLFVDPASPSKINMAKYLQNSDCYTRYDDALTSFIQFHHLLVAANSIADLESAKGTHMWITVETVLKKWSYAWG